jgi:hypothetical protein
MAVSVMTDTLNGYSQDFAQHCADFPYLRAFYLFTSTQILLSRRNIYHGPNGMLAAHQVSASLLL